jgi:SNF2 family DNA or RNA helicase
VQCPAAFNVLLTTYETAQADATVLAGLGFQWQVMVVDEAHRLKTHTSRLAEALSTKLRAEHRLLLTGTPIQNGTAEVWSLLRFADPTRFGPGQAHPRDAFLQRFLHVENAEDAFALQAVLRPYLLRRAKKDVLQALPPKRETMLEVELTLEQKRLYCALLQVGR